jgi:ADP-ribose pyrophosphatase
LVAPIASSATMSGHNLFASFRKQHKDDSAAERSTRSASALTHTVHLSKHPSYPPRCEVKSINWDVPEPSYHPQDFTHKDVLANERTVKPGGWADPEELSPSLVTELKQRTCNTIEEGGKIPFGPDGRPRNPVGRTGLAGRGLLGKWGPNYAADPLVTRFDPSGSGMLQMVAIQRADTKAWAMPGGMVDDGEQVSATLRREFGEEANASLAEHRQEIKDKLEELFSNGEKVYVGCKFV